MDELIEQLTDKVDISEEQAQKVVDVVADFVGDKLPDALAGPVLKVLEGNDDAAAQLKAAADGALGQLGGMFGK